MEIIPVLHRLLVQPEKLEDVDQDLKRAKALGLEIPDTTKRQEQTKVDKGIVKAIGPTAFVAFGAEAPQVQVGDLVVYAKYGGKFITDVDTGIDYIFLNDEDIIGVLK